MHLGIDASNPREECQPIHIGQHWPLSQLARLGRVVTAVRATWIGAATLALAHGAVLAWRRHQVSAATVYGDLPRGYGPAHQATRLLGTVAWLVLLVAVLLTAWCFAVRWRPAPPERRRRLLATWLLAAGVYGLDLAHAFAAYGAAGPGGYRLVGPGAVIPPELHVRALDAPLWHLGPVPDALGAVLLLCLAGLSVAAPALLNPAADRRPGGSRSAPADP